MHDQQGGTLIITMIFIFSLGLIIISLTTMVTADARVQALNAAERRAFYAAQSGIEYALRGMNHYAISHTSATAINNYSENIDTGNNTTCDVEFSLIGTDSILITATGISQLTAKKLERRLRFIDVSYYAVYSSSTVQSITTIPSGRTRANATHMPFFDLDVLRTLSQPSRYYSGALTLTSLITIFPGINFIEGNLTFNGFINIGSGSFVSGGNVLISNLLAVVHYNIYQFNSGSTFTGNSLVLCYIQGGLIVNGPVSGRKLFGIIPTTVVRQDRTYINSLMRYTVNGGPVIYKTSTWDNR
jgi:Tfp pilus assembly protein PilX